MLDPQTAAERFAEIFEGIHRNQMQGLPLLNTRLQVETLGFQEHRGRIFGVLITPWLMNVVLLPGEDDDWSALELGDKQPQAFPGGSYKFMVNEVDGIGRYQAHSLYSPMREFTNQNHALAAAEAFLRLLMTPAEASDEAPIDEDLLGRVMRGEDTPEIDVDALESVAFGQDSKTVAARPARGLSEIGVRIEETEISRRDLLRGRRRIENPSAPARPEPPEP